jgi:hypothetical protein
LRRTQHMRSSAIAAAMPVRMRLRARFDMRRCRQNNAAKQREFRGYARV